MMSAVEMVMGEAKAVDVKPAEVKAAEMKPATAVKDDVLVAFQRVTRALEPLSLEARGRVLRAAASLLGGPSEIVLSDRGGEISNGG